MLRFKVCIIALVLIISASVAAEQTELEILYEKAGNSLYKKNFRKALDLYLQVVELDSNQVASLKNIGVCYSALGNPDKARVYLERALKIDPRSAEINHNLGAIYAGQGDTKKAIARYEVAIAADSANPLYLTNLGQEYSKDGRISEAMPLLRKALKREPGKSIILFSLANCFATMKNYDSAEVYYINAVKAGGATAELYYFLGFVQQHLRKTGEARQAYSAAINVDPNHQDALKALGGAYMVDQMFDSAIVPLKRLTELDDKNYQYWTMLGAAYAVGNHIPQSDSVLHRLFDVDSSLGFQMLDIINRSRQQLVKPPKQTP